MHPPTPRWALVAALTWCLAPGVAGAGALEVPQSAEDAGRILLDGGNRGALGTSAFDVAELVAAESTWFEEGQRGPVASAATPLRALALEDPNEMANGHRVGSTAWATGLSRGAGLVDAWFLLAVPFLLPLVLRRRQRRTARSWADQVARLDHEGPATESALDAILRGPSETPSPSAR